MTKRIAVLLVTLLLAVGVWADGTMLPASDTVLSEAKPSIPSQRAVLKFDGREEILIVESVLQGPKGRYGWVVPLPAQPSYVKAVKPEYISGTFRLVEPRVLSLHENPDLKLLFPLSILLCAAMLTAGMRYRKIELGMRVLAFFVEAAIGACILLSMGADGRQEDASVHKATAFAAKSAEAKAMNEFAVRSLGTIGSYDVNVVSGDTGKPLLDWMRKQDIKVPEEALPIIDAYAKRHWCFLAAEIRKDEDGPLPPHPLKAVFPAKEAIYPMRLTGIQDGPMRLELIVVSDRRAKVEPLESWKCTNDPVFVAVGREADLDRRIYADWRDGLYAMAKDGSIVTYLRADLKPSQMREDYKVSFQPYERFEAVVIDRKEAGTHALWLIAMCLPLGAFMMGLLAILAPVRSAIFSGVGAIAAIGIALAVAGGWYGSVERVDTVAQSPGPIGIWGGDSIRK